MTAQDQALVVEALRDVEQLFIDGVEDGIAHVAGTAGPIPAMIEAAIMPTLKNVIDNYIATKFPPVAPAA